VAVLERSSSPLEYEYKRCVCVDNPDFEPNTINFAGLLPKNYPLKIKIREEIQKAREQENPLALSRMSKDWTV